MRGVREHSLTILVSQKATLFSPPAIHIKEVRELTYATIPAKSEDKHSLHSIYGAKNGVFVTSPSNDLIFPSFVGLRLILKQLHLVEGVWPNNFQRYKASIQFRNTHVAICCSSEIISTSQHPKLQAGQHSTLSHHVMVCNWILTNRFWRAHTFCVYLLEYEPDHMKDMG